MRTDRHQGQVRVVLLDPAQGPHIVEQSKVFAVGAQQHLGAGHVRQRRHGVRRRDPGDGVGQAFQPHRRTEIVRHPVFDHFELHRPDGGQHRGLIAADVGAEHLDDSLVLQLLDAAAELLETAGVLGARHLEVLRGEQRDGGELHRLLEEEAVADPQRGRVDKTHDVAGEGFVDDLAFTAEDLLGVFGGEGLAGPALGHHHAAFEDAGADPDEGDVVPVRLVHAGLDLEDETGERGVDRAGLAVDVGTRGSRRSEVNEGVEDFLHAEVERGRAEEDRRRLAGVEGLDVELEVGFDDQPGLVHGIGPVITLAGCGLVRA